MSNSMCLVILLVNFSSCWIIWCINILFKTSLMLIIQIFSCSYHQYVCCGVEGTYAQITNIICQSLLKLTWPVCWKSFCLVFPLVYNKEETSHQITTRTHVFTFWEAENEMPEPVWQTTSSLTLLSSHRLGHFTDFITTRYQMPGTFSGYFFVFKTTRHFQDIVMTSS